MRILIAGDFCQRYRIDALIREQRYAEIFDEVRPMVKQADYSIVNFEFPIIVNESYAKPISKCGPNLKGSIESILAVKYIGFDCCTLANNHILDHGYKCCLGTKEELEKVGIDTVGVGRNTVEAASILYKDIQGERLAIINCCEHEFSIATDDSPGANSLNTIQQYYQIQQARKHADYVLVITHGGHEHFNLPSIRMKETYRFFIDAGADAVVNHHQHCYSGYETYHRKPIFYGIGNFCFDNPNYRAEEWNEGFMVELSFTKGNIGFNLHPYTQCSDAPSVKLLDAEAKTIFSNKIESICQTIINDRRLKTEVCKYYENWAVSEMSVLEPYMSKVTRKLLSLGLLPRFITGRKIPQILNHIECESHRDKLIYALTSKIWKQYHAKH